MKCDHCNIKPKLGLCHNKCWREEKVEGSLTIDWPNHINTYYTVASATTNATNAYNNLVDVYRWNDFSTNT